MALTLPPPSLVGTQCPACEQGFAKHSQLRAHEYEHTSVPPFACDELGCEQRFLTASLLKKHVKTHTQIYRCIQPQCGLMVFSKWSDLAKVCVLLVKLQPASLLLVALFCFIA